ncbi:hypoxanthine phosphoribosyltransferase [Gaopeijia maritima]|uniref:Hypoxanthine phosphoribosyltransferase n=1 Tax=Gaopeijia maritima TaxID=3119007 RepID=A0ABU9EDA9_9BACT
MSTNLEASAGQLGGRDIRRVVYSEERIATRVREMADEITHHFGPDDDLLVVGLLKGSFVFLADLVRRIQRPLHVDFLVAASYGTGTVSTGDLKLLYDPEASLRDRSVVIVEDIIDSGHTLQRLVPLLREREPRSLDVCTLLHKRLVTLDPAARWVGFDAPSEFLVGYGLDHAEDFRHLPYVASL